jgi:glutathione synthase/RimK-type ligase-like ATP-grasp enzyme
MKIVVYPYKLASKSATALADALTQALRYKVWKVRSLKAGRLNLNWGHSSAILNGGFAGGRALNPPHAVNIAGNKLLAFQKLQEAGVSIPEFTTDRDTAEEWTRAGLAVVARTVLRGHSGEGIHILQEAGNQAIFWVDAPLYVKYKKKKYEYRVHVFNGQVIDIQQKRKEREVEQTDEQKKIRSHANGWVFCREDLDLGGDKVGRISNLALSAIDALGLDFGAVDIIYNQKEDTFYCLEVNCAPGLEGTTLEKYVNAIVNYLQQ